MPQDGRAAPARQAKKKKKVRKQSHSKRKPKVKIKKLHPDANKLASKSSKSWQRSNLRSSNSAQQFEKPQLRSPSREFEDTFGDNEEEDEESDGNDYTLGLKLDTSLMKDPDDLNNPSNTSRRRNPEVAPERVSTDDIMSFQKLTALPRPSMAGDPPRLKGVRVGRFRLDLHDYEEWQGDVGVRVSSLGEKALEHLAKSGETSNSKGVSQLVQNIGREAFELTRAVAYDTRSKAAASHAREKLAEAGLMKPRPKPRGSSGDVLEVDRRGENINVDIDAIDEDMLSSEDESAQIHMIKGLDTRGLYVEAEKGAEVTGGEGGNDELDSDEDWDTSEWGKEDVESACMALLDEIETATSAKRHRMATMMLVKLVLKHNTAVDYLDGGMESLLEKGLRMQHHGITLASRNLTLVLSKVAAVHSLAERMSAMSAVVKCIKCTNAVLDLAASVVQLRFRFRRYVHGRGKMQTPQVRARNKMIMLQRIVDTQAKFREVRLSPNGGEIPDENLSCYIELLCNMTKPSHSRAKKDAVLVRRHGGMITLIRAIEYSDSRFVRRIACQTMRHLCMQDGLTLYLLRAGAAHPLGDMLAFPDVGDRNDALEVIDLLAQRCFPTTKEMQERDDMTEHWRDLCRSCGSRCGKQCKRPEFEAARYLCSVEILETLLGRYMVANGAEDPSEQGPGGNRGASTRIGALMVLHKLAAGPGANSLATVLCLGQQVRRRKGHLRVHAVRGRGLPNADDYSAMDPYVKVTLTTPHEPNLDTGQDHTVVKQTKPALEAGMHPVWSKKRHNSVLKLPYNAPEPLSEENKKKAEHAAWLLGNENGLCEKATLKVEVVDFDFVGDHDMVSETYMDVDDMLSSSLVLTERWYDMTPPVVDLRMGDEPPKPHFGRFGPGGQLRIGIQYVPHGAKAIRRPASGPVDSEWAKRRARMEAEKIQERKKSKGWGLLRKHVCSSIENDRPAALEALVWCMQSEAPGESSIALQTFQQLCHAGGGEQGVKNRAMMINAGALELLLPLAFDSGCVLPKEPPVMEVMSALRKRSLLEAFVCTPVECDDHVFATSVAALVTLSGNPVRRKAELADITLSTREIGDLIRQDLLYMTKNQEFDYYEKKTRLKDDLLDDAEALRKEGPVGLRLLKIGALPHVLRFLITGESLGEDPYIVERTSGGMLTTDAFVRLHAGGPNGQPTESLQTDRDNVDGIEGDLFTRRTERRRIAAICIYRLIMSSVEKDQSSEEKKRQEVKRRNARSLETSKSCEAAKDEEEEDGSGQRISYQPGHLTQNEVAIFCYLPSVIQFLISVLQENNLARLSGEVRRLGIGSEARKIYYLSTEACCLALQKIARLPPDGRVQPRARHDVATQIMALNALHDVIGISIVPVETSTRDFEMKKTGKKNPKFDKLNYTKEMAIAEAEDYRWQVRNSVAAVKLLASCLPRVDQEGMVPDEQSLEVEALRAVVEGSPDGKFLTKCAKEALGPLIRVLLLAGQRIEETKEEKAHKERLRRRREKKRQRRLAEARVGVTHDGDGTEDKEESEEPVDVAGFALPDLLIAVSFCLSRICCTQATASMAYSMQIVPALAKVVPTIPRLGPDFRTPDITKRDYRPKGELMQLSTAADSAMLLQLPASVITLLAALARVRVATEDLCGCGFLERMIARFFTASIGRPENDLKVWGEVALFFARIARGGKNVKGYGSCNEVLVRSSVLPKLVSMFSKQQKQHRRVRLHAMLATAALLEDSLMSAPILMQDDSAIAICLAVAMDGVEIEPIRRQALLIIRSLASFPNARYHPRVTDLNAIPQMQSLGRMSDNGALGEKAGAFFEGNDENLSDESSADDEENGKSKELDAIGTQKKEEKAPPKHKKVARKVVQTGAGSADASPEAMSLPSLGQLARDVLESMGAEIEEAEKHQGEADPEVTPWGKELSKEKGEKWVPFKERDLTPFEREALYYERNVVKEKPTYAVGEVVIFDLGRYYVLSVDSSPNPPDRPYYDLAHIDDGPDGKCAVQGCPEDHISPAPPEEGGMPHHKDIKNWKKNLAKKRRKGRFFRDRPKTRSELLVNSRNKGDSRGGRRYVEDDKEMAMVKIVPEALVTKVSCEANLYLNEQRDVPHALTYSLCYNFCVCVLRLTTAAR